jgi:hypothetical protein
MNRAGKINAAFFCSEIRVHDLDSYSPTPLKDIVNRFANASAISKSGNRFCVRSPSK